MKTPTIIAAIMFAVSPISFQAVAAAQSTSESSADRDRFEIRWSALASASKEERMQRLREKAATHCSDMADRGIEGYSTRHEFEGACARTIERQVLAQLAKRLRAKEKGARLARRPSSN